jgi:hypothetical protein
MGGRDDIRRIAGLAARQHGNVTFVQLRALGVVEMTFVGGRPP